VSQQFNKQILEELRDYAALPFTTSKDGELALGRRYNRHWLRYSNPFLLKKKLDLYNKYK
jgi:hypothetical protein